MRTEFFGWEGCLIWSRGRHFSLSLPDIGPTGTWHLAHSVSDPRAEISGILVMVRRSSATSRCTTSSGSSVFVDLCFGYLVCACANLLNLSSYRNQEKKKTHWSKWSKRETWNFELRFQAGSRLEGSLAYREDLHLFKVISFFENNILSLSLSLSLSL